MNEASPRREFVGQVTASVLALATAACAQPATVASPPAPAPTPTPAPTGAAANEDEAPVGVPRAPTEWDDTWFGRITAQHKAVFEQEEIDAGSATSYASRYLSGMADALGKNATAQAILVFRHRAMALVLNDAMWAKYGIGEERKLKGAGGVWMTRNPVALPRG